MKRATAIAHPNIALIKYWGKRDVARNLPAVGSISITLDTLRTRMSIDADAGAATDRLWLNGRETGDMLPRVSACLDAVAGCERPRVRVDSHSNFPVAAGLASSASAFAALTVAAAGTRYARHELAALAGAASGSAARSLYGGFVELANEADSIRLTSLAGAADWPLNVVIAITEAGPKPTGSTEAMEISRRSSPFYSAWVERQAEDLAIARSAVARRDFALLASVAEHNCLKMHSVMWTSRPPTVFWNAATLACLQSVRELQREGHGVFFTIDAGPQVKAVCLPAAVEVVSAALRETPGVIRVVTTGLGHGAHLLDDE